MRSAGRSWVLFVAVGGATVALLAAFAPPDGASGTAGLPAMTLGTRSDAATLGTTATTASGVVPRDEAAARVERVLIVGDSLVWYQDTELRAAFGDAGVEVRFAGGPGTGLLSSQMAWVDEIAAAVAESTRTPS